MQFNTTIKGLFFFFSLIFINIAAANDQVAEFRFANGNKLLFNLETHLVEFVALDSNDNPKPTVVVMSGLRLNRVVDNVKVDQEYGSIRNVPVIADKKNPQKSLGFTAINYIPKEKLDLVVFEAGDEFHMVNSMGVRFTMHPIRDGRELDKYVIGAASGELNVVATKWHFKGVNRHTPSIASFVAEVEGGSELFVVVIGSNGKMRQIPDMERGYSLNYEPKYNKLFVEKGGEQIADYDISALDSSRISSDIEKTIKYAESISSSSENTSLDPKIEAFVKVNFPSFEHKIEEKNGITLLPDAAFDLEELNDIRRKLATKPKGSALIVGESGAGKSELLKRFVKNVKLGLYKEIASETEFLEIDSVKFLATDGYVGRIETKINNLIEYAKHKKVIVVLENIHIITGGGTHSGNTVNAVQMLASAYSDGTLQIIATTTADYDKRYFAGDEQFNRSFGRVFKKEIPKEKIDEALERAAIKNLEEPLSLENRDYIRAISQKFDAGATELLRAVSLQKEVYAEMVLLGIKPSELNFDVIKKVAARKYGVDLKYFDIKERQKLLEHLITGLDNLVAGQKDLKESLKHDARALLTTSGSGKKPLGRRLLFGDRGLGKTYIPEVYANLLGLPFERIKLDENTNAEMIKTRIAQAIRKNSMTVFLIDEVEKTRTGVQNELLDILDSPTLLAEESLEAHLSSKSSPKYVKYSIANATFFLATNAGAMTIGPSDSTDVVETKLMADNLSRYVLDRVADLHHFQGPQTREEFLQVLEIKIKEHAKTKEREKGVSINIQNKQAMLAELTDTYFRPGASYRGAIDDLESAFKAALSELEMKGNLPSSCSLTLSKIKSFRNSRPASGQKQGIGFTAN